MDYVRLGNTDLSISRIGFGGCPMGQHGWGKTDSDDLSDAIERALELGVTLFDTADIYGLGAAEKLLGQGLQKCREEVVIATKFGVRMDGEGNSFYDNSEAWICEALDASLRRLAAEWIDIYQIHYWDGRTPLEQIFATLERQREAGKIRYYGVSNIDPGPSIRAEDWSGLVTFSDEYSLVNRTSESRILATCKDTQLTFLSWGSLGQGILSGKYDGAVAFPEDDRRSRDVYVNFHGDKLQKNLAIVEHLKTYRERYETGCSQLALRYILDKLPGSVALVGVKNRAQIEANCAATGWRFTAEDLDTISGFAGGDVMPD